MYQALHSLDNSIHNSFHSLYHCNKHLSILWSVPRWEKGDSELIDCAAIPRHSAGDSLAQAFLDCGSTMINQDSEKQGRCWNRNAELVDSGSTQKLEVRKEQ